MLDSILSDHPAKLVAILTVLVISCSVTLLGVVVLMHLWRLAHERRERRFTDLWSPIFFQSVAETAKTLPVIQVSDWITFMQLYNNVQESIVGEAKDKINVLSRRVGFDRVALKLMRQGRLAHRLTAIIALGNLREHSAENDLQEFLLDKSPHLSLLAAWALLRIDARSAIARIAALCGSRADWSPVRVIQMLNEAGTDTVGDSLSRAAAHAPPDDAVRLLGFLEATRCITAVPLARDILGRKDLDDRLTIACIRLLAELAGPEDLPDIRGYLQHHNWCVRLHAVKALGRLGSVEDENYMISLLDDDNWWVRFRTAEALANSSFMTMARLIDIKTRVSTKAQEVLTPFSSPHPLRSKPSVCYQSKSVQPWAVFRDRGLTPEPTNERGG
jgi:HEAT repeat protein